MVEDKDQVPNRPCASWDEVSKVLEDFPAPQRGTSSDGERVSGAWIFRGLQRDCYGLRPSIEREADSSSASWSELEFLVSSEFKSRAALHLAGSQPQDELT